MNTPLTSTQRASLPQTQAPNPWFAVFSVALSASVFCAAEFLPVGLRRFISQALGVSEGTAGLMVTAPAMCLRSDETESNYPKRVFASDLSG